MEKKSLEERVQILEDKIEDLDQSFSLCYSLLETLVDKYPELREFFNKNIN